MSLEDHSLVLEGLPPDTCFTHVWVAEQDTYRMWLASYTHGVYTVDEISHRDLRYCTGYRYSEAIISRKIAALRQRHYFACAYSRGGCC